MRPPHHTTDPAIEPSLQQIGRWPLSLFQLHERLAARFVRSEPRRRALGYLQAIISDIPRKNGWQIAEHAKERRPYGMQRLLSQAVWDHDGVRDDVRTLVYQSLQPPSLLPAPAPNAQVFPVRVIDESGFPKR